MELDNVTFNDSGRVYEVDRNWQDAFVYKLYDMGFDSYGIPDYEKDKYKGEFKTIRSKHDPEKDYIIYFENDTFILMPYYWGEDSEFRKLANFVHKPTGFKLQWYKYALRSSYMNKKITFDELMEIMEDCKRSLGVNDIPYHYKVAIEYIEKAIEVLHMSDNKQKTRDAYNKLKRIKGMLNR